jgi:hypothetical protein
MRASSILPDKSGIHQARRFFVLSAIGLALAGCATVYEEAPAPADTEKSNFVTPVIGTKLNYRTFIGTNSVKQEDWIVVTPAQNQGNATYALKSGSKMVVRNRKNGNWMATFIGNEKTKSATPDDDGMRHPLWVGKKWMSKFVYDDYRADRQWSPVQNFWSVQAKETITVEAGTFETYRLKSDPGLHSSIISTVWFSPKLGVEVKRTWERLEDHYLGAQKGRVELVKIIIPSS